jgi:predicted MPP superfamily phosphohydrolase
MLARPPSRLLQAPAIVALGLLLLALLSVLAYALAVEPARVMVVRHDLRAGGVTSGGAPWRLVQVSDLHLQALGPREQALARRVQDLQADVVVLTGDAIDRAEALPWLAGFVRALGSAPVLLVPGNWEHWSGVDFNTLQASLAGSGAHLVLNDRWTISKQGRVLQVIGLDDSTAGVPDLRWLASGGDVEAPDRIDTVLVQHSPGFFAQDAIQRRMVGSRFTLCLSGHTHGGQVAFGGWAPWRPAGSGPFVAGFYDVPGCRLFVSRGVGMSVLPIRLGSAPEVVVFEF